MRILYLYVRNLHEYCTYWGSEAYTREKRKQVWKMTRTLFAKLTE